MKQAARSLQSSHGGVLETLRHLYWSDRIWLARFEGTSLPPKELPEPSIADLQQKWPELFAQWRELIGGLTPQQLADELHYRNTKRGIVRAGALEAGAARGEPWHAASRPGDEHAAAVGPQAAGYRLDLLLLLGRPVARPCNPQVIIEVNGHLRRTRASAPARPEMRARDHRAGERLHPQL